MKTLLVFGTHFIDEAVISEYRKMKNTPNVDAILAINNNECKFDFQSRVENKIFFDTSCKCFFFDSKLHEEMQLPYITFNGEKDFGGVMWHNGDYRFYYLRKFFTDYDYYWLIEYDVFCNAETYEGFLEKFKNNHADLLVNNFRIEKKQGSWCWTYGLDWIYNDVEIFGSLFPVVRLSARAADFLYKRRLEHKEIFQNSNDKNKRWIFCELFTPTELMNGGFSCENLNEKNVALKNFYLNDERFFLQPDNHLYHPVKSVKGEISKHQAQYAQLFLLYRKVFLTSLVDKINSICAVKNLPVHFDKEFNFVIFDIPKTGGGTDFSLRYEARFIQGKIFVTLVFDGEQEKNSEIINQCSGLNQLQPLQLLKTPTGKALAYIAPTMDNVPQVANAMKILIESTYNILLEKNL